MESIIKVLEGLLNPATLAVIAVVVEFSLRLIKSEKPLSILHLIAAGLHQVSKIAELVAQLLDRVLPQRLSSDKPEAPSA